MRLSLYCPRGCVAVSLACDAGCTEDLKQLSQVWKWAEEGTGGRRIARGEVITFELTWVETSSLSLGPGPRPWHHNPFWTQAPASDWSEVKQYWLLIGWEPPLSRSAGHPHCQLFGCFLPSLSGSWQTVFVFSDSHFLLLASAPQIVIGIKTEQIITWTLVAKSSPG